MKTGECKYGERCKFHHPLDRSAPVVSAKDVQQPNVKLTLAGLPRREVQFIFLEFRYGMLIFWWKKYLQHYINILII